MSTNKPQEHSAVTSTPKPILIKWGKELVDVNTLSVSPDWGIMQGNCFFAWTPSQIRRVCARTIEALKLAGVK